MGWTVRGSNSGGGEIFRTCPDRTWGPPSLLYNGYRVSPGVKSGWGVKLTPHPFLCRGQEKVELYLYTSCGPYGLYRASVPVQWCTLPLSLELRRSITNVGLQYEYWQIWDIYYCLKETVLIELGHLIKSYTAFCGPGSSVGIATELRAGRSGIEFRWGWDFPPWGPPSLL